MKRYTLLIVFGVVCLITAILLAWNPSCNDTDPAKFIGGTIPGGYSCAEPATIGLVGRNPQAPE